MTIISAPQAHRPDDTLSRSSSRQRWLLAFGLLGAIYLMTATWGPPYNVDSYTNLLQARSFAADASPIVEEYEAYAGPEYQGRLSWMVPSPDGPTSQYPPGVAIWGAPFYLLDDSQTTVTTFLERDDGPEEIEIAVPAFGPGALAAVTATTLAFVFLALTLRPLLDDRTLAVVIAVAALGTGAWSVASDQLWQHSPGMMAVALGMLLASRDRFALSGLAFAFAVVIRPHTALMAAGVGLIVAFRRRSLWPALRMGAASALGLAVLALYNQAVWGEPSITGGYSPVFTDRLSSPSVALVGERIVELLFHPAHGLLVSSSFIIVGLVAVVAGRARGLPDWALGGAVGAVAYTLVQLQANRVSGGNAIFGYRYPLEPLVAAAPLLVLAGAALIRAHGRRGRLLFGVLATASVLAHGYGAIFVTA